MSEKGVLLCKMEDVILLIRKVAVNMHSLQNWMETCEWKYKALATFNKCWCFLSTIEFYSGHSTQDNWWMTPLEWKKSVNFNSGALSSLNYRCLKLSLNHLKELRNDAANIRFVFYKVYSCETCVIIYQSKKILVARMWCNVIRPPGVTVYQIKSFGR